MATCTALRRYTLIPAWGLVHGNGRRKEAKRPRDDDGGRLHSASKIPRHLCLRSHARAHHLKFSKCASSAVSIGPCYTTYVIATEETTDSHVPKYSSSLATAIQEPTKYPSLSPFQCNKRRPLLLIQICTLYKIVFPGT